MSYHVFDIVRRASVLNRSIFVTVDTTLAGLSNYAEIPIGSAGSQTVQVDWGDGISETASVSATTTSISHTYAVGGKYVVTIVIVTPYIRFFGTANIGSKIIGIDYQNYPQGRLDGAFSYCRNLTSVMLREGAIREGGTSMQLMFVEAEKYTGLLDNFTDMDISGAVSLNQAFDGAVLYNGDITKWATMIGSVTAMNNMLRNAHAFNRDLASWVPNMNLNVTLVGFMAGKTFNNYSPTFYGNFLTAMAARSWAGRSAAKTLGMGTIRYTSAAASARAALVADGWTITDGGQI